MRIAIVEPYYGGSHRAWADGYRDHSANDVVLFSHDARFWKWRMHGSYITLAEAFVEHVSRHGAFDVLLVTDMLHLPAFLGAIGPARHEAAVALYMHENQLSYPLSPRDSADEAYAMINWASMTVADRVFFNSRFHHDSWFDEIPALLRRFPDYRHTELLPRVAAKSSVLTVGVDLQRVDGAEPLAAGRPLVLWNQRWDFDKGPGAFADAIIAVADTHDFAVALAGEQVGALPEFVGLQDELGGRIAHVGFLPDDQYARLLATADIVVSTATQEFFGIAITEAAYAGALPLVPDDLVYPERIPPELHALCLYDRGTLADRLRWVLDHERDRRAARAALRTAMAPHDWTLVAPEYDTALSALGATRH